MTRQKYIKLLISSTDADLIIAHLYVELFMDVELSMELLNELGYRGLL